MVPLSMQEVVRSAVTAVSETSLVWPYHIITSSHKVMQQSSGETGLSEC